MDERLVTRGPGFWAVTKHADILEVSKHPELFCSGKGATSIPDMPEIFLEFFGSLINTDDPKHKRLRSLVSAGFTPAQLRKASDAVRTAAVKSIDKMIEKGEGDFIADIAAPFPIQVICDIVGIPESQHQFVYDTTNIILGATDPEYIGADEDMAATVMGAGFALVELMKDLAEQRLKNPTDDLTSVLVQEEIDGDRLTQSEMGSFCNPLAAAGNAATRPGLTRGRM